MGTAGLGEGEGEGDRDGDGKGDALADGVVDGDGLGAGATGPQPDNIRTTAIIRPVIFFMFSSYFLNLLILSFSSLISI